MGRKSLDSFEAFLTLPEKGFAFVNQIWHYKALNQYSMAQKIRFMLFEDKFIEDEFLEGKVPRFCLIFPEK